ncbi:adenosylcobinamide-GDP ribazoletransferase [Planococcus beigongshangi]|uniref:adenosylcobinamide-GDP ribazoletransferase n=1 Tax=Planococcus beigongshangi TaxID=2782536 RepID=UPI00193BCB89|nr:adenosylcobinamide-GDP ribazoletransferase [Planococcus beigongshangi]
MSRNLTVGLLLALQFFSVIPVKKNLPMEKAQLTAMYAVLPLLGLLFGSVLASATLLIRETTDVSSLLMAFVIVAGSIILTGGLHLDGLADVGDAYFSYQDREKRLEIMGDPRIGAFGTMVLILFMIGKVIVISEMAMNISLWTIVFIPIVSKIGLMLLFSSTASAKNTGLAAYFQKSADRKRIAGAASIWLLIVATAMVFLMGWQITGALLIAAAIFSVIYRQWCRKNFGGVTGDLFGAYVEGTELLLWTMLLLFI